MKYLIIAAIVALAFVVIYSRLRPYLLLIRKVVNSLNVATGADVSVPTRQNRSSSETNLVRCAGCGTWIPENRAMNLRSGLTVFCSPACLEKKSEARERKLAG